MYEVIQASNIYLYTVDAVYYYLPDPLARFVSQIWLYAS